MNLIYLKTMAAGLTTAALLWIGPTHAAPVAGQGTWETTLQARDLDANGSTDAFYDIDLNITWLRNANVNGAQTWATANAWANNLSFGGYDDWRLSTIQGAGTSGCNFAYSGTDCGYNVDTTTSEMAHLFHVSLGNKSRYSKPRVEQSGYGLTNTGDFLNMPSGSYWSGADFGGPGALNAWMFYTDNGSQSAAGKSVNQLFAMAVRPGDVTATPVPVPEPATLVLTVAALAGLSLVRRRAPTAL